MERREYNCGLEIKTPSSKKLIQGCIREVIDLHGAFSCCEFGLAEFKQLIYKPECRTQVLHHATVANLPYVLFVVAGETKVHYATLIQFPESKKTLMKGILRGVYHCSLKWAYTIPSGIEDPSSHVPDYREMIVSSKGYTISKECVCFTWIIWRSFCQ